MLSKLKKCSKCDELKVIWKKHNRELYCKDCWNSHPDKKKKPLKLTSKEFEILHFFIQREGQVISRDTLLDEVWGYEVFPTTRTVDNYILALRKKIEADSTQPRHLLTIPKAGYKFVK